MSAEVKKKNAPAILIVDDAASNRQLLTSMFEAHYRVNECGSGQDALDMLKTELFDVVILDIMMPGMNGLDVLKKIRARQETHDLPVILISAMSDSRDVVRGLKMGANDYITKPIDVNIVMARVSTQITLKHLLDERKATITEMERAHEMRERLFMMASHDLKGPLANIRMSEYLLRAHSKDNPKALTVLDNMLMTVTTMQNVIEDFLDKAVLDSGQLNLAIDCVPVERVLWDTTMQYNLLALKKSITLEMGEMVGAVKADEARLRQILSNMLTNAIKFSPPGSTVRLWSAVKESMVRIYVSDEGPGVPTDERDRLFTEFGRLSTQPTGGESSTGLGLWIVKRLVDMHAGQVGAEFPGEGGAVFWVSLPMCNVPTKAVEAPARIAVKAASKPATTEQTPPSAPVATPMITSEAPAEPSPQATTEPSTADETETSSEPSPESTAESTTQPGASSSNETSSKG